MSRSRTPPRARPARCEAWSLGDATEDEAEWGCDGGRESFSSDDSRECAATLEMAVSSAVGRRVRSQPSSAWSPSLDAERDGNLEDGSPGWPASKCDG